MTWERFRHLFEIAGIALAFSGGYIYLQERDQAQKKELDEILERIQETADAQSRELSAVIREIEAFATYEAINDSNWEAGENRRLARIEDYIRSTWRDHDRRLDILERDHKLILEALGRHEGRHEAEME